MILLDTSAIIELISGSKQGDNARILLEYESTAISAVTISELLVGETKSKQLIIDFLKTCHILPFDSEAAYKSVEIEEKLRSIGKVNGKMDIFIAATCFMYELPLLTFDKGFKNIEGLKLIPV